MRFELGSNSIEPNLESNLSNRIEPWGSFTAYDDSHNYCFVHLRWGSFNESDGVYKEVKMLRSYELALKSWADWLDIHIDNSRTRLFFMSMSPTHERAEEWDKSVGQNCYNETEMIARQGYQGRGTDPNMMKIVEKTIDELKTIRGLNVQLINITQLSEYRKEGHPSIYRKQWDPLTQEQQINPSTYADCIHWCLPGVPDVWNELLYAYIFNY